jgi:hypothetical protein
MRAEAARVRRLQRLERVRAQARQVAAREAAEAEGTLAQLMALASRTATMIDDYRGRTVLTDGYELRQQGQFLAGISGISWAALGDAAQARATADRKQQELALAERRRAAAQDRAKLEALMLDRQRQSPALGSRRAVGTVLE